MKKVITLILAASVIASCASNRKLVQKSDISIVSKNNKYLYLKDSGAGSLIYDFWKSGVYGYETEVFLVNEEKFNELLSN